MVIPGARCTLRAHRASDAEALATAANDYEIARWMAHRFPSPYTLDAARNWLTAVTAENPVDNFVVEVDGGLAGGAGILPHAGELHGVADFGYWLNPAYWGRGIATEAAQLLAAYAFGDRELRRLQAYVFAGNAASVRVLENAGFAREAVLRETYVERDGTIIDGLLFARLRR